MLENKIDLPISDIFGKKIPSFLQKYIESHQRIKDILMPFYFSKSENEYAVRTYLDDVRNDIEQLKKFHDVFGNYPLTKDQQDDGLVFIRNMIEERYKRSYCPSPQFECFNDSIKAEYMFLRFEIDKLLEIKDTKYQL